MNVERAMWREMSPWGELGVWAESGRLVAIDRSPDFRPAASTPDEWNWSRDLQNQLSQELAQYAAGQPFHFRTPIYLAGTDWQLRVWRSLQDLVWGETTSYGDLARALGQPSASRAVGKAVGENPLLILVPCHRVLGAAGEVTGYRGGLTMKRALLELESAQLALGLAD
ncbi:MAG TPA: methylated-DNA--[protein]-cysteine S-methyltransferase [Fimbriimonadaceae bacterium]|nr:methylated-DNA--[protein]-cysteine S-methyltransferase [Fimbriimonadaceae bacterium]HRJ33286.1 methylated-DNA--[protein]-cysteine S-methyltransferase [Fimbriimonadaceae bacterium]